MGCVSCTHGASGSWFWMKQRGRSNIRNYITLTLFKSSPLIRYLHLFLVSALWYDRNGLLHRAVRCLASTRRVGFVDLGSCAWVAHWTTEISLNRHANVHGQSGEAHLNTGVAFCINQPTNRPQLVPINCFYCRPFDVVFLRIPPFYSLFFGLTYRPSLISHNH